MTDLEGKHFLIVGGSEGIGFAVAKGAAARGATVSVVARRPDKLSEAIRSMDAIGDNAALSEAADACDPAALTRALAVLVQRQGQPFDVVLTAVGGALPGYFVETPIEEFHSQMDVNFFSAVNVAQAVLPSMIERKAGHLVFTASTAAVVGVFGYTTYGAAKWALRGFAESLRYEVAPDVRISVAYPPDTFTTGYDAENLRKPPETFAVAGSIKPMDPDDVAEAILRGIEKNRLTITADPTTRLLSASANVLSPFLRAAMNRTIAKSKRQSGPVPTNEQAAS